MRLSITSSLLGLGITAQLVTGCESGGSRASSGADAADSADAADEADAGDGDGAEALDGPSTDGVSDGSSDGVSDGASDGSDDSSVGGGADATDGVTDGVEADGTDVVTDGTDGADSSVGDGGTDGQVILMPAVVATIPEDGQKGVMPDASIAIEFSVPMDAKSVEAAWMSKPLPAEDVIFSWDVTGRFLSVTPKNLMAVATGVDHTEVEATPYWFMIGEEALAADGTPIGADVTVEFTTIRHIVQNLPVVPELTGSVRSDGTHWTTIWVGDSSKANSTYAGVLSFDLKALPAGAELANAMIQVHHAVNEGQPYQTLGKASSIYDATFDSMAWSLIKDAVFGEVPVSLGAVVTEPNKDVINIDVVGAVAADVSLGANLTQFAVGFPSFTDSDDAADNLELSKPVMIVDYVVP